MANSEPNTSGATVLVDGAYVRLCMNAWTGATEPCRLWCRHLDHNSGRCTLSPQPPSEWERGISCCIQVPIERMGEYLERG